MELLNAKRDQAEVSATVDELMIISNALNEVCNGLDLDEFQTRMGVNVDRVRAVLRDVQRALDDANKRDQ